MAALPQFLAGALENHGETIQQAALLNYLKTGDSQALEAITTFKLCNSVLKTLSKEDEIEAARAETTLAIAKWVKDHPYATQAQTQAEVQQQIDIFKQKIKNI
eukprot:TRINITY_DN52184_c0_g1_i1.p1 TRINITY_DN52184_c0_g1~~TRINITY_DN52184_c0_g1_i1.p1  ORF type:complete len:103 (+),score=12.76 TRINITY_DN52184_c0_g1_i1:43-351(+)